MSEVLNVEELFASKVFTVGKMKERLPRSVFKEVKQVMEQGGELSLATADVVAKAMKDWAVENGATSVLEPELEPWGQRTCYIADPEGNLIEIGSWNKPYEEKDLTEG